MDFGIFTSISKNYLPVFVTLLINESFWGDFNQIEDGWLCRFQMILMQLPPALRYPTPVPFSTLHVHYPFHTYRRLGLKYHHYSTILWVSVQANRAFLLNISVASTPEWKVLNTLWIRNRVGRLIRILLLLFFFFLSSDKIEPSSSPLIFKMVPSAELSLLGVDLGKRVRNYSVCMRI